MPRKAPFLEYLEEYERRLVHRSGHTRDKYPRTLRSIWRTAQELGVKSTRSPRRWTREEISMLVEARRWRQNGGLKSNQTIRHELHILSRFLRFCGNVEMQAMLDWGELALPPDTVVNARWLSLDDVVRLRVQSRKDGDHVALLIVQLGLDALLRAGEMAALTLSDIHGDHITVRQGKGRKDRLVSIRTRTWLDVQEYVDAYRSRLPGAHLSDALLAHSRTTTGPPAPYSPKTLGVRVRELGRRCDPPLDVSPHDLRRSGGMLAYVASPTDQTVRDLQAAYGHKTTEQTRRYIGAAVVDQRRTFQARDEMYMRLYPEEFGQP